MNIDFPLHHKQGQAFLSKAQEIGYGGAAGGGKSHLLRIAAIIWCFKIAGLQVYLFRRQSVDLEKNHIFGPKGFLALLAPLIERGLVQYVKGEIRFKNGSKIWLCHCQYEKDIYQYQGAEMHVILMDEGTHFSEPMYRFLRSRARIPGLKLPKEYEGQFPKILVASNPGGVGHHWYKQTFVDFSAPYLITKSPKSDGGMTRQYIPATLDDNPSMEEDDPGYEDRLEGLGSPELVRAMRWGDWDAIQGAFPYRGAALCSD